MKLAEIIIENFKGISEPVRIKIDDIVVLIGNNNVGKTTILSAYEAYATAGCKLSIKDFYLENTENIPVITGIFEDVTTGEMAEKWIHRDEDLGYERCIKVQYRWASPEIAKQKYSFDPEIGDFVINGTGGFDSILLSRIPTPLKISPMDNPAELESKILSILTEAIKSNIKEDQSNVIRLLGQIEELARNVKAEIEEDIRESTQKIADDLSKIFPEFNHVEIDVKSGKLEPEKLINAGSFIRVGATPAEEGQIVHRVPLSHHGTGLQRTFLWSALKMLAETGRHKVGSKTIEADKSKILLIEEPEAFLHPSAIREAREALYAIASLENWQVMATTHSPLFIDLTKDHTTIIRIEKEESFYPTIRTFSTEKAGFTDDDKENLKMMNFCNPYINEFFFANNNLLVEGETEYSVIKSLLNSGKIESSIHILNCIGKGNITTVSKILNHFSVPYCILHDSDNPTILRDGNKVKNGAWTINEKIVEEVVNGRNKGISIKTFVSIPNFEGEFLGGVRGNSKPYQAWKFFQEDNEYTQKFINLLNYLSTGTGNPCPLEYNEISNIIERVRLHIRENDLVENELWDLDHYYAAVQA